MKTSRKLILAAMLCLLFGASSALAGVASPYGQNPTTGTDLHEKLPKDKNILKALDLGDLVDFDAAQLAGADYLKAMQADITEDNAGNGTDGVDETPDDPDDGGWDWRVTSPPAPFHHSTSASSTNLYGATAIGLYYTYLEQGGIPYLTALTDAADTMANNPNVRSGADLVFLMLYNDLSGVSGTAYMGSAKAKYDGRIATYGSATAFAEYIRDARAGQGYENGIIAWDIGVWARAAAMLDARYPGNGYDADADDIAEVIWQDSFNDSPGYFDVVDDQGFDPTFTDKNFWWYNLGITGLIDAFDAADVHTSEIPGLVSILLDGQYGHGGFSYCYGANTDDEDWQSTAYAMMTLGRLDQATYQDELNRAGYYLGATQDASGGWVYSSGNHYPEIGGECVAGLYFTTDDVTNVIVDDDFTSQADVDAYNSANGTNYTYGYDAFGSIQEGIDAVSGSTVNVAAGTYVEQVHITSDNLNLVGSGAGSTIIQSPANLTEYFTTSADNYPVVFVDGATGVVISDLTVDGNRQGNANYKFVGVGFWNSGGTLSSAEVLNIMDTPFSGAQHGVGVYAYNNTGGPYTVVVNDVVVDDFQKTAVALSGDGLTVDIDNVTVIGAGPTSVTAQNGIQIGFGAGGTVNDCSVTGIDYTGASWTASGALIYNATNVDMTNVDLDQCQSSVYYQDASGTIDGCSITNPSGDGLIAYSYAAKAGQPRAMASPMDADLAVSGEKVAMTVTVSNTEILGTGAADSWATYAYASNGAITYTVTGCTISDWTYGVVPYDAGPGVTADINNNAIVNCDYALGSSASDPAVHDAESNWYGVTAAADVAAMVDGAFDYSPWYGANYVNDPHSTPWVWYVDDVENSTIQEAIDGATSGDTIYVSSGTYNEQVTINKNLAVLGEDAVTTIIDGTGLKASWGVRIPNATGTVLFDGFTCQNADDYQIVLSHGDPGAEIHITNNIVVGNDGGPNQDYGLYGSSGEASLFFMNNTVTSCSYHGHFLERWLGPVEVAGNSFTGVAVSGPQVGFMTYENPSDADGSWDVTTHQWVHDNEINCNGGSGVMFIAPFGWSYNHYKGGSYFNVEVADNHIYNVGDGNKGIQLEVDGDGGGIFGAIISDNTITAQNPGPGHTNKGIRILAGASNTLITGNTITGFQYGFYQSYSWGQPGDVGPVNNQLTGNHIYDNVLGVENQYTASANLILAEGNWWGTYDGPEDLSGTDEATASTCYDPSTMINAVDERGYGLGNTADDNVDYCPWISEGVIVSPTDILYHCSGSFTFDVAIALPIANLEAGSYKFTYPADLTFEGLTVADPNITAYTQLDDQATGYDELTIDFLIATGSLSGPADLFTIELSGSTSYCSGEDISLTSAEMYDSNNDLIDSPLPGAITLVADCNDPVFTVNGPADGDFYNTAPVLDIGASDDCDIDGVYYQVDGCDDASWTAIVGPGYTGSAYADGAWMVPGFAALTEDEHCVRFKVIDDNERGNADSCSYTWCFTKDVSAPAAPTDLVAEPGHNKVKLSWSSSTSGDVVGYRVQRVSWDDYPWYLDGTEPAYPVDEASGTNVFDGAGNDHTDTHLLDNTTRDVYYYAIFAYDAAGNYSPAAASAQARSTSYWLGDIADDLTTFGAYDGFINHGDLTQLGFTYWSSYGDAEFEPEADWGPTVTSNPKGIPEPDSTINILDLAIFAINYGTVNPTMKVVPLFADKSAGGALNLTLAGVDDSEQMTLGLSLNNADGQAKIAHVVMEIEGDLQMTSCQPQVDQDKVGLPVFAKARQIDNIVEFDFALIGSGATIAGSGELARFAFSGEGTVKLIEAIVFDNNNEEVPVDLVNGAKPGIHVPDSYELSQNFPNPFNPTTQISFQLPQAGQVTLEVFNLVGQRVTVLVDEYREAGIHTVTWHGVNEHGSRVSSGVYFYRLNAADVTMTRKMMLLK